MNTRNSHIDALRGAAILCVLVLHFALAYGLKNSPLEALPGWLLRAAYQGNYGVTMFFVISGYLITSTSLRRWGDLARIDLAAFYVYRIARLLPSLLLALSIIVMLGTLDVPFFANSDGGKDLPASYFVIAIASVLTFWHNVLMQSAGYFNYCLNVYWSLSVEEMFYLLLPLSCRLLRKRHWILLLCGAAIVAGPAYRSLHADNEIYFMYGYFACFDAIAIGCLTALLAQSVRLRPRQGQLLRLLSGLALAALYVRGIGGHEVFGFTWIAVASAAFILGGTTAQGARPPRFAPLQWLGRHSYELYLFHIIVLAGMRNVVDKAGLAYAERLPWLLVFLAATALAAALVARYLSEPANAAIRRRFRRSATAAPSCVP
ncbi:acyltransferase family protein [Janthinobacterium sp. 1_2014MBL_MicDiv]|uniref:acyltransferase family protein n=1 Tax=Janthinobacterium sp. 1_2014MBL_MicDiv TaxID=1644131 RepID=UPI0008F4908E|nr:acyltransferase [Janthinobacterium sp. 1_2014MBL_MicDiv]APA68452.1 O-antigen acetylase [Janthinobacterium sp. 1_2014MBL_MicDiv]